MLDLYCDAVSRSAPGIEAHEYDEFPHQFVGPTLAACRRQARCRGWKFSRDGERCYCPKCSGKRRTPK